MVQSGFLKTYWENEIGRAAAGLHRPQHGVFRCILSYITTDHKERGTTGAHGG